jgi:hypothetical protein
LNFLTYLTLRFAYSPVGEGIQGAVLLIVLVIISPVLLALAPFGWIWMVWDEWKEGMAEEDKND